MSRLDGGRFSSPTNDDMSFIRMHRALQRSGFHEPAVAPATRLFRGRTRSRGSRRSYLVFFALGGFWNPGLGVGGWQRLVRPSAAAVRASAKECARPESNPEARAGNGVVLGTHRREVARFGGTLGGCYEHELAGGTKVGSKPSAVMQEVPLSHPPPRSACARVPQSACQRRNIFFEGTRQTRGTVS